MNIEKSTSTSSGRNPIVAVLLSMAAAGLGHIYCGRLTKGLVLFFLSFVFAPVIVYVAQHAASNWMFVLVVGSIAIMLAVFIYAVVDAAIIARRSGISYQLKEYNRWYIYILLIVVSLTYPTNLASSIRENVLQAFKIPSSSMMPSIQPGDHIFLNKAVYKTEAPKQGDVIVFTYPNDRSRFYIKRIIAMPGDSIEIRDNVLYLNEKPLEQKPVSDDNAFLYSPKTGERVMLETSQSISYPILIDSSFSDMKKTIVPNGHCFVLGDNRSSSKDSRYFGPVPLADVLGRLDYIYWPAKSWQRWGRYEY